MNKILLSSAAIAVLLLSGCGDDKKTQQATAEVTTKQETTKEVTQATPTETTESSKTTTENSVKDVKEETQPAVQETKETNTTEEAKVNETKNEVKEDVANTTNEVQEVAKVEEGPNGELLFKACASCHGQKGEKEALGKSQVIAGWDKEKTINAIKGYKDGTYGKEMKNIMKTQVSSKTDEEIEALATFISNL